MSTTQIAKLVFLALLGHILMGAWVWAHHLFKDKAKIYNFPETKNQRRKEFLHTLITPIHALLLFLFTFYEIIHFVPANPWFGIITFTITYVGTEIWFYFSHRLMHHPHLHFIHRTHHESRVLTPFSGLSFSLLEKFIFSLGILSMMAVVSRWMPITFNGIFAYYVFYLILDSLGHCNLEWHTPTYLSTWRGKLLQTPTYHAMHHARYVHNYGLSTRFLDRLLGTEWIDYAEVYATTSGGTSITQLTQKFKTSEDEQHAKKIRPA